MKFSISAEHEEERLLVIGATGWFGRSVLCELDESLKVLPVASRDRAINIGARTWQIETLDMSRIKKFQPTTVVNCAFLTLEKEALLGTEAFQKINNNLIDVVLEAGTLPTVKSVLTFSSGAVTHDVGGSYGALKRREEEELLSLTSSSRCINVARVYSVSGPHVTQPMNYAFSSFVNQAKMGQLEVLATRPVFRRYVAVSDVIKVSSARMRNRISGLFETGGQLIEMRQLAEAVRVTVNPRAIIKEAPWSNQTPSIYASDDTSWQQSCKLAGVNAMNLIEQIRAVAEFTVGP